MKPTKIWANLGVKDVAKTREFYSRLGFARNEGHDGGPTLASFRFGEDNFVVHFFEENHFKEGLHGDLADLTRGNEIMFTLWADSKEEADTWANEVRQAGGNIFSEPAEFGKGYYGFGFADPDGHKWNVFNM